MIKCSENCPEICDFCVYFDPKDDDSDKGFCIVQKVSKRLSEKCNDFHCFRKLDLTKDRHREVNYRMKEKKYKVAIEKLNQIKDHFFNDPNDVVFKKLNWIIKLLDKRKQLTKLLRERIPLDRENISIGEVFNSSDEHYIDDILKMDKGVID